MNNAWIHNLTKTYITEVLKVEKPRVLLIGKTSMMDDVWDIKPKDLVELKKIAEVDLVTVDNMTEEKLAEKCSGYDYYAKR